MVAARAPRARRRGGPHAGGDGRRPSRPPASTAAHRRGPERRLRGRPAATRALHVPLVSQRVAAPLRGGPDRARRAARRWRAGGGAPALARPRPSPLLAMPGSTPDRVPASRSAESARIRAHSTVGDAGGGRRLLDRPLIALRGCLRPPPHPKYRCPGGLFQAPGCAPYSLAASDEGSNAMGTEERAAMIAGGDPKGIDTFQPDCCVLGFQEIDETQVAVVGGKGAQLGELSQIEAIRVPPGFCVTTNAFRRIIAEAPSIDDLLDRLSRLNPGDRNAIRKLSAEIRRTLEGIAIPDHVAAAITLALAGLGEQAACAVRSSATAEDLPTASFAGQHDTYLNIVGPAAILQHVSRAWASLFTERAVTYRLRNGFDHRKVYMAVVVQQMVFPHAAGILFTADPVTSNRKVASVEASFGLGEALVSGLVNADVYKVRDGEVVARTIGAKRLAIHASPAGGTQEQAIDPERQDQPALTDAQVLRLAQLGRRIEAHFGRPQDVEWCLVDDGFQIVQSRPITTLFPIPESGDGENHVYVSVGHQQMMTDPMKPLGLSFWQMTTPAPMAEAGRRPFVDVPQRLASPTSRAGLLELAGSSDPLTGDALQTILERDGFIRPLPGEGPPGPLFGGAPAPHEP